MLMLSKKMIFAIEAVVDIAYHSNGLPVQSQAINKRQRIPNRYLEQALQQLVRADILSGVRGPRGGYNLARERCRISVGDIVRVVGTLETTTKLGNGRCRSEMSGKIITPMCQELQASMMKRLDLITIDDLCNKAVERGVERKGYRNLDFTI